MILEHKLMTASGIVTSLPCYWAGCLTGHDRANDPQYEVYDDKVANTDRIVDPEWEADASAKGKCGWTLGEHVINMKRGIYVTMSGTNAKMVFLYKNKADRE